MAKRKAIRLGNRDKTLIQWYNYVTSIDSKMGTFLIKQALYNYIKKKEFIDIGHINRDDNVDDLEPLSINLWIDDSAIIAEWFDYLSSNKQNSSLMVREILKKCITIVENKEDVKIPNYFDFDDYRIDIINGIILETVSNSNDNSNNHIEIKQTDNNSQQSIEDSVVTTYETNQSHPDIKLNDESNTLKDTNAPNRKRMSSLSGTRVKVNELNDLI